MVPKDKVTRLRMKLAEGGLPKGGGVGYEVFDKSDALGTTSFVQNINHLRALEGELARTIRAIDRIQAARVHLVLPERPLFSREAPEPSASIVVRVRGCARGPSVRAIRHLVASAVNGLKPQRVSIVDEAGSLLADGAATDPEQAVGDERRTAFEKRMRKPGRGPSSPPWSAPAAPASSSPPISTSTRSPRPRTSSIPRAACCARARPGKRKAASPPTTTARSPSTTSCPATRQNSGPTAKDQSKKTEETNNYEISRTTKTEVTEAGRVNRISVAVLVDGIYSKNEKGEIAYRTAPRNSSTASPPWCARRSASTRSAATRSRSSTCALPTPPSTPPIAEPSGFLGMLQFTKDDVMYFVELGVMMLLGLVVLFLVIRPLVKRILASEESPPRSPAPRRPSPLPEEAAPCRARR